MFSNKFTSSLIFYLGVVIVLFFLLKYLGGFMGREHFTNANKMKNAPEAYNIVYNSNGGYPSD
jgi:hypothetical protein